LVLCRYSRYFRACGAQDDVGSLVAFASLPARVATGRPDVGHTDKDERLVIPHGIYLGSSSRSSIEMYHNGVKQQPGDDSVPSKTGAEPAENESVSIGSPETKRSPRKDPTEREIGALSYDEVCRGSCASMNPNDPWIQTVIVRTHCRSTFFVSTRTKELIFDSVDSGFSSLMVICPESAACDCSLSSNPVERWIERVLGRPPRPLWTLWIWVFWLGAADFRDQFGCEKTRAVPYVPRNLHGNEFQEELFETLPIC